MRRFFGRLPVNLLFLAELIVILPILTLSAHVIQINEDVSDRVPEDGTVHQLGAASLPHTVELTPPSLPTVLEPPEESEPAEPDPQENADAEPEDGGEVSDPGGEDVSEPGEDTPGPDGEDPEGTIPAGEEDDPVSEENETPAGEDEPGENEPDGEDPETGEDDPESGSGDEPPVIIPGGLPASDPVDASYFDDAVFIGDSVSLKLQYYVRDKRKSEEGFLGKAQFLTAGSFSYINALTSVTEESVHPSYQGTKMLLENAVAACGAKKLYIMLGMNDIAGGNYDNTLRNLSLVISRILEKAPDVTFYFESVTPRMADSQTRKLNNEIIRTYNQKLQEYCEENGYYYVDVYSVLCDEEGNLPSRFCSDPVSTGGMGIHFTNEACAVWIDYLYTHTA